MFKYFIYYNNRKRNRTPSVSYTVIIYKNPVPFRPGTGFVTI